MDGGYVDSIDAGLIGWADVAEGVEIVVVPRNADVKGFQVLPRRWVVERTFSCSWPPASPGRLSNPTAPIETEAARRLADDLNH